MSNEEYLKKIITENYLKILGREPDDDGLNSYYQQILSKKISTDELHKIFKNSQEYKLKNPTDMTNNISIEKRMECDWDERAKSDINFAIRSIETQSEKEFWDSGKFDCDGIILGKNTNRFEQILNNNDFKDMKILEIGCGWGGFAEYAAGNRGANVKGLTISQEQHDFAVERINKAGLSDKVEIVMQDYRDEADQYDGIASIEMFEAVGEKYWPIYFDKVNSCLKPAAKATLQIITIPGDRFSDYRNSVDFIQKYIFPGGMLPTESRLKSEIKRVGLEYSNSIEFGKSYSETLRQWFDCFNAKWEDISEMGFDDRFRRMWNIYLTSCASAFEFDRTGLIQITMNKPK